MLSIMLVLCFQVQVNEGKRRRVSLDEDSNDIIIITPVSHETDFTPSPSNDGHVFPTSSGLIHSNIPHHVFPTSFSPLPTPHNILFAHPPPRIGSNFLPPPPPPQELYHFLDAIVSRQDNQKEKRSLLSNIRVEFDRNPRNHSPPVHTPTGETSYLPTSVSSPLNDSSTEESTSTFSASKEFTNELNDFSTSDSSLVESSSPYGIESLSFPRDILSVHPRRTQSFPVLQGQDDHMMMFSSTLHPDPSIMSSQLALMDRLTPANIFNTPSNGYSMYHQSNHGEVIPTTYSIIA